MVSRWAADNQNYLIGKRWSKCVCMQKKKKQTKKNKQKVTTHCASVKVLNHLGHLESERLSLGNRSCSCDLEGVLHFI